MAERLPSLEQPSDQPPPPSSRFLRQSMISGFVSFTQSRKDVVGESESIVSRCSLEMTDGVVSVTHFGGPLTEFLVAFRGFIRAV